MLGPVTITITPRTGSYSAGRYVPTDGTPYTATASVQDSTPRTVEFLPEGAREKCTKIAYVRGPGLTIRPMAQASGYPGDKVTYAGRVFYVVALRDHQDHLHGIPHVEAFLAEVGADE
jgi:hypothetical protein